jgi:glycosyltransferase involved in cell wall biosynthesis
VTRLALLTEIPAPYRIPLFNALAARLDLRVLFLRERHPDRPYDPHADELRFASAILPGLAATLRGRWVVLNAPVSRKLNADAVVLGGWNQPAFWEALTWCRRHRVPAILWTESTRADWRSRRLDAAKRLLLRGANAFVVPGSAARDYLLELGAEDAHVFVAPNAVDPGVFGKAVRTREHGPVRLVAVGRLAPEKGLDTLLAAARDLPAEVVLAGSGPDEARLRALAGPNVSFLGHIPRDEVARLLADADAAVLPSRSEPWGMILNEAALAGLPLVATTAAGAAWDLVEDGANGFRVAPDDVDGLRAALRRLVEDDAFRRAAGARSREIAARFTPEAWADGVVAAVSAVTGQRRPPRPDRRRSPPR